jgi:MOSC domain-containing protein YiiM
MARVVAVSISEKKGEAKRNMDKVFCRISHGIVGDAHAGNWHRQISLLGVESIEVMVGRGAEGLSPGSFAENITTEGINVYELKTGAKLKICEEVILEITQIGKECHGSTCSIFKQLGDCIMPRQGVFSKVVSEGWISPGDEIICLTQGED